MGLTRPLFSVVGFDVTGRALILFFGGLFLLAKSTREIHHRIEGSNDEHGAGATRASFSGVLVQILLLDIVFSLDSVVTAVGMADEIPVMIVAVVVAVAVMMIFSQHHQADSESQVAFRELGKFRQEWRAGRRS
jgi:predicted tellurium resistance membrane protein TerC